ncbi:hypothetical protein [Rhodanobacter sp. DHG33]|uniref:hypothetical protein n=1 Tax=Rhodanobacter sp. DHG33 TaxID=2775921 RepID=UPI0017827772|nr:hypothetical protein [Rhodanobacter sp. DHG33]MBD8898549.1 hypothetical protein [Rhodanobacter sp. DHG33]
MTTAKVPSLVTKRRRNLLKQPAAKSDPRKENLWAVRAFDGTRIVLASDLALEHFFFAEGDPTVATVQYPTEQAPEALECDGVNFDALVTYRDGNRECRHVRAKPLNLSSPRHAERLKSYQTAATHLGAAYVEVTVSELDTAKQRIRNWARLIAAYRRCSHRPLEVLEKLLAAHLTSAGETTFQEVLTWIPEEPNALKVAAIARLLRRRLIASDLDEATLSLHTRLWMALS